MTENTSGMKATNFDVALQLLWITTIICVAGFLGADNQLRFQITKYSLLFALLICSVMIKFGSDENWRKIANAFSLISQIGWIYLFAIVQILQRILADTRYGNSFSMYNFEGWLDVSIDYYWNHVGITFLLILLSIYAIYYFEDLRTNTRFLLNVVGTNISMGLMLYIFFQVKYLYGHVF